MICDQVHRMLATMTESDWSTATMSDSLPTGTVTLLLADIEGSTGLWQSQPEEMAVAVAGLDRTIGALIATHSGVRPVEQGEGDSFVIAFARASDATACAAALQRAPLAPIRLRVGLHTGEVQLRDEGNYIGTTINRAARLRELAHGGQTVLSGTTADLVAENLPDGVYLAELGSHTLRDLPRPERVTQLCHADLVNEFPPLRTTKKASLHNFPAQLTSFVGRVDEINATRNVLAGCRLVTLTGAGGVGKTRLAIQVADQVAAEFDGTWYVDLAPVTDPEVVPIAMVRALGLLDQPGRPATEMLSRFIGERRALIVLDNCEHLLDACAQLVAQLLTACPHLVLLTTSREPIGVAGEAVTPVPPLPCDDDAVTLFADRARLVRPDFVVTDTNSAAVSEICRRLDGMPLALELAAARIRALSLTEILDSLHDRFLLLTGGARTAVRRQQTLYASVDWSHALLTETERILLRRLAVFMGGFDLDAARAVAADGDLASYQVLDVLTLLVDKSLVLATDVRGRTRYRLLETIRQYAQERLNESGEAYPVRTRHRDYYGTRADTLGAPAGTDGRWRIKQAEAEIDNLRAAFGWSRDTGDVGTALRLASALWPVWVSRGQLREASGWFDAALSDEGAQYPGVDATVWVQALANKAMLHAMIGAANPIDLATQALAAARETGDTALVVKALTACAGTAAFDAGIARPYADEAIGLTRQSGDLWQLSQILAWRGQVSYFSGDPATARRCAEEGHDLACAVGDQFVSRAFRWAVGWAELIDGQLSAAAGHLREVAADAAEAADPVWSYSGYFNLAYALAHQGDTAGAYGAAASAREVAEQMGGFYAQVHGLTVGVAALAAGDVTAALEAHENVWNQAGIELELIRINLWQRALVALADGDLTAARRWADDAVAQTSGWHRTYALLTRTRVALAQHDPHRAAHDAATALASAIAAGAMLGVPDLLECLAEVTGGDGNATAAARLLGAAEAIRRRTGEVRFAIFEGAYAASVVALRDALGENEFDQSRSEGADMSTDDAVTYALRGRSERKRPASGWESLTPAEHQVVRLVCEGLANKEIAARLFVSPRTVHAHLTHVYAKLGVASRVQLVREAAHHAPPAPRE